jgi:hypothetical protein
MKKQSEGQNRQKRVKRLWMGEASDLDRINAGRDPRQLHFAPYADSDASTNPLDPGKKQPTAASEDTNSATQETHPDGSYGPVNSK